MSKAEELLERITKLEKEGVRPDYLVITPEEWNVLRLEAAPPSWLPYWQRPPQGQQGTLYGIPLIVQEKDPFVELVKEHYGD